MQTVVGRLITVLLIGSSSMSLQTSIKETLLRQPLFM